MYSDSPNWKSHIESEVLPRVRDKLVILNWSHRAEWPRSLEVMAFRHWGGEKDFNPIAILFPPQKPVLTLRFYSAFRDFRHGKPEALRTLEEALFRELGAGAPP